MSKVIRVYIDDDTETWLQRAADEHGRSIENLAESAVSEAAVAYKRDKQRTEEAVQKYMALDTSRQA